jgi:hypothetical protein
MSIHHGNIVQTSFAAYLIGDVTVSTCRGGGTWLAGKGLVERSQLVARPKRSSYVYSCYLRV